MTTILLYLAGPLALGVIVQALRWLLKHRRGENAVQRVREANAQLVNGYGIRVVSTGSAGASVKIDSSALPVQIFPANESNAKVIKHGEGRITLDFRERK